MASKKEQLYKEIIKQLKKLDNFLVTTHLSADGDAYASALATAYLLKELGKTFDLVFHDQQKEEKYKYLWGWDAIQSYREPWPKTYNAAVVLDVPSKERIGKPASLLPAPEFCIKIDHHPQEETVALLNLVDTKASSTSQLVYEVISRSSIGFSDPLAILLFSGIMYDTGRFSFSNTSRRDFEIAAHLLQYDVKPHQIANQLFFSNSFTSMKTIGYGLANMESFLDGKLCIIYLPYEIMQANHHSEIEELANYSVAINGVEVGLFIRQTEPGFFKISFRSRGKVNVNKVARVFGGGGHAHAAGCRIKGKYESLKKQLIDEVARQLQILEHSVK